MSERARSAVIGVLLAVALLLLGQLTEAVRDQAAELFSNARIRWSLLLQLVAGGLLAWGVVQSKRDWVLPATAAFVLAIPLLPLFGIQLPGALNELRPTAAALPLTVAVGVLATGAALGTRRG